LNFQERSRQNGTGTRDELQTRLTAKRLDPLTRIENACRRLSGVMLTAPNLAPKDSELVRREIQEIGDALEAFKAAVEAGEVTGFKDGGMRAHDGA
jgi:hypothetical protein